MTATAAPAPAPTGRGSFRAVLKRPPFTFLVIGQTISQLGDKLHHMALIALVGSAATTATGGIELAKLSVVFTLPVVLFGPLAGALVDRWNKRLTMVVCDAVRAVIVILIPWLYGAVGRLWPVYVVAFCVFLLGTFFNAAKMALIPDLVERNQLLPANAALTSIGRVATVVGVVGGGMIIGWPVWRRFGWSDYAAGFYMDAMSYGVSVSTLLIITALTAAHLRRAAGTPGAPAAPAATQAVKRELAHLVGDVKETWRCIRTDRTLRFAFETVVLLAAIAASVYVVMTASVQKVFGMGTRGVGFLGGLLAVGLILGSLFLGTVGSRWDKRQTIMVSCTVLGVLMVTGSLFFSFAAFAPIAVAGGAMLGPIMVSQDTLLHEGAPTASRALVFSTRDLVLGAAFMLSALLVGGAIAVVGAIGVGQPYRLALGSLGVLISAAGLTGEFGVLRGRRQARA